jgi:hypothetical protein
VEAVRAAASLQGQKSAVCAVSHIAEREGCLRERTRWLARSALLIVDEIGYLPVVPGGASINTPADHRHPANQEFFVRHFSGKFNRRLQPPGPVTIFRLRDEPLALF